VFFVSSQSKERKILIRQKFFQLKQEGAKKHGTGPKTDTKTSGTE
jgi:hypothetical protein